MAGKPLVYFLCTGNACRSQMAEGFARALAGDRVEVASAGTAPTRVHPLAIAAMAEVGVDIADHRAKPVDPELLRRAAVVVTLCGEAEETCPVTPSEVRRLHWPLPDPARAAGSEAEVMAVFRTVRDAIRGRVTQLLQDLGRPGPVP